MPALFISRIVLEKLISLLTRHDQPKQDVRPDTRNPTWNKSKQPPVYFLHQFSHNTVIGDDKGLTFGGLNRNETIVQPTLQ
jgi:hypothetical protein